MKTFVYVTVHEPLFQPSLLGHPVEQLMPSLIREETACCGVWNHVTGRCSRVSPRQTLHLQNYVAKKFHRLDQRNAINFIRQLT
jgi:hypothetical protein